MATTQHDREDLIVDVKLAAKEGKIDQQLADRLVAVIREYEAFASPEAAIQRSHERLMESYRATMPQMPH